MPKDCYYGGEPLGGTAMKPLLIDLDGTLYHGSHMIPEADRFILSLRKKEFPYLFVTNNSSRTPEQVALHLSGMGIPADSQDVCTSAMAAARYIAEEHPGARVYCIGEEGLQRAIVDAGLQLVEESPDVVVQGIDRHFTYDKLAAAMRWIMDGAKFVMTNPDLQLPASGGLIPGAGTLGAAIEAATQVKPLVIGKPSGILMDYALELLGVNAADTLVVGDNIRTDIAAGAAAGCKTALVLTGVSTRTNMEAHMKVAAVRPDYVFNDLPELLTWLER